MMPTVGLEHPPSKFITVLIFEYDWRSARNNVILITLSVLAVLHHHDYGRLFLRLKWFIPIRRMIP